MLKSILTFKNSNQKQQCNIHPVNQINFMKTTSFLPSIVTPFLIFRFLTNNVLLVETCQKCIAHRHLNKQNTVILIIEICIVF